VPDFLVVAAVGPVQPRYGSDGAACCQGGCLLHGKKQGIGKCDMQQMSGIELETCCLDRNG
jgi:hypothetical protein